MINGEYIIRINLQSMFCNKTYSFTKHNLITYYGAIYLFKRILGQSNKSINGLGLGTGVNTPSMSDTVLEEPLKINTVSGVIKDYGLLFTTTFKSSESNNATEIGLYVDDVIITHDLFDNPLIVPQQGFTEVEYYLNFSITSLEENWQKYGGTEEVYMKPIHEKASGVYEINDFSGRINYNPVDNIKQVEAKECVYYQDKESIFIHTKKEPYHDHSNVFDREIYIVREV